MTNSEIADRSAQSLNTVYRAMASPRRREIVRFVAERSPAPVGKDELSRRVAAVLTDSRTDDDRRVRVELHHRDLPALKNAGVIAETDDGGVVATDHWAFETTALTKTFADEPPGELDAVFGAIADERRRAILCTLEARDQPVSTQALARAVAERETGAAPDSIPADRVDRVLASLVHVHLPALADADLVAYDIDESRVAYEGHPMLRDEWPGLDDPEAHDRLRASRNAMTALVARVAGFARSGD
ncbi:DUF7344 domain-containing protein [Halosolutus gelatinilyticus]|uniref:DUF7344 domain-containing protein n=1 Tax=Halosolutus gelatinilyticus TaxID=2931975 RepID=UPI001FF31370|nr:hypothetical protein [Halosolutus gelatinilyticus]